MVFSLMVKLRHDVGIVFYSSLPCAHHAMQCLVWTHLVGAIYGKQCWLQEKPSLGDSLKQTFRLCHILYLLPLHAADELHDGAIYLGGLGHHKHDGLGI